MHLIERRETELSSDADPSSVRLYRGQASASSYQAIPEWIRQSASFQMMLAAAGRWFTASLDEALWYSRECDNGEVVFIDIPRFEVEKYRVSNLPVKPGGKAAPENPGAYSKRPHTEFFIPQEMASQARLFTLPEENMDFEGSNSLEFR